LAVQRPAQAATNNASWLKIGEVREFARASLYSAASLFVLTKASPEQRTLVISGLAQDGSPKALDALGEIAAISEQADSARLAFDALLAKRPASVRALRLIAQTSYDDSRRQAASEAAKGLSPEGLLAPAPSAARVFDFDSIDLGFAKKYLRPEDFTRHLVIGEEATNGARYQIQTWFLKKILSLQNAPNAERQTRFDFLMNEIAVFLQKKPQIVKINEDKDLEQFKESLVSRFAYLSDEMKFSKGLSAQAPIRLEISAAMREKVEEFSESFRAFDRTIDLLGGSYFFDALSNPSVKGFIFRLELKAESDAKKLVHLRQISDAFEAQYKGLKTVAPKLLESKAIQFANPAEQRFFELMINHYFSTYSFEETANVMKAVIERPDRQKGTDLFHLMVMYAGPQMQKLLQVVSRRPGISPELQATFKRLEESGLPSPWERVSPNFTDAPEGSEWVRIDRNARVGSMAETYKAQIRRANGEDVTIAVRTLKSDIRERVEREIPRLEDLGREIDRDPILRSYDFPLVGPVMDDVMAMARNELDVAATIEAQRTGRRIYTATRVLPSGIKVYFETAETLASKNPDVIYSTWIQGEKFEDFVKRNPSLAIQVAELTSQHWIENALFKERFFHADLHQGNLKVSELPNGDIKVGLLDFGMVGRLSARERSTIIKLSLATFRNRNAVLIAKYLYELAEPGKSTISLQDLTTQAKAYLEANRGPLLTMDIWIGWSLSKGVKLPKNITAFSRGIGAVDQLTQASGSKKWIAEVVKEVALRHKLELAPDLVRYLRDSVVSSVTEAARKLRPKPLTPDVPLNVPMTCSALFGN
jgi:predicted unusual protein kinase regulating ubiquinone biosynthesis (AarF/ABC1/UbiB family)